MIERLRDFKKVRSLMQSGSKVSNKCNTALPDPRGGWMHERGCYLIEDNKFLDVFSNSHGFETALIKDTQEEVIEPIKGGVYDKWSQ